MNMSAKEMTIVRAYPWRFPFAPIDLEDLDSHQKMGADRMIFFCPLKKYVSLEGVILKFPVTSGFTSKTCVTFWPASIVSHRRFDAASLNSHCSSGIPASSTWMSVAAADPVLNIWYIKWTGSLTFPYSSTTFLSNMRNGASSQLAKHANRKESNNIFFFFFCCVWRIVFNFQWRQTFSIFSK